MKNMKTTLNVSSNSLAFHSTVVFLKTPKPSLPLFLLLTFPFHLSVSNPEVLSVPPDLPQGVLEFVPAARPSLSRTQFPSASPPAHPLHLPFCLSPWRAENIPSRERGAKPKWFIAYLILPIHLTSFDTWNHELYPESSGEKVS